MTSVVRLARFNCYSRYRGFLSLQISDLAVIIFQTYSRFIRGHAFMHVFIHSQCVARMVFIFYLSLFRAALLGVVWLGAPPPCLFPAKTGTVGFFPFFFTRFISTSWIFACAGFSAVSDLDNHLRDLIRY